MYKAEVQKVEAAATFHVNVYEVRAPSISLVIKFFVRLTMEDTHDSINRKKDRNGERTNR